MVVYQLAALSLISQNRIMTGFFSQPLQGSRVLVVERRSFLRRFLVAVLEDAGAETDAVSSLVEGMAGLRTGPYGVVVCGAELSGLRHFLLAATSRFPGLSGRVVLVAAAGPSALQIGQTLACPVLVLPFSLDELIDAVQARLRPS
jgi:DNA-binding response OmpR family regulator